MVGAVGAAVGEVGVVCEQRLERQCKRPSKRRCKRRRQRRWEWELERLCAVAVSGAAEGAAVFEMAGVWQLQCGIAGGLKRRLGQ